MNVPFKDYGNPHQAGPGDTQRFSGEVIGRPNIFPGGVTMSLTGGLRESCAS